MSGMKVRGWVVGACAVVCAAGSAMAAPPANDNCASAITASLGTQSGTNVDATGTDFSCGIGGSSVWYSFTAAVNGTYQFDTDGAGTTYDTVLEVFNTCGSGSLGCNDDFFFLRSRVQVVLAAGQNVKVAVGGFFGSQGDFQLNVSFRATECCEPWDNGDFDRRNAQTSQIGYGQDWKVFGRVTADDFWLCEGNVYRINTIGGKICTDSVVPKAQVYVFTDCDGTPGQLVAIADSIPVDVSNGGLGEECRVGTVSLAETGEVTDNGFRILQVAASFPKLWLKGGQYWVAIVGYSGTADPDEQFFWGTSNNQVVRGKPGRFYDSDERTWTDIDEICCGCTDFNFCVQGEKCKILLDNGSLDPLVNRLRGDQPLGPGLEIPPGSPSLQNGSRTADKSRTADNFVVPPCHNAEICYIEAWLLSNCQRARLDIYAGDCHLPQDMPYPIATVDTDCLSSYGTYTVNGQQLTLYKAEFYNWQGFSLEPGNYWLSVYALGDGRQNARGYFVNSYYCDRSCQINFDPGAIKGPPHDTLPWRTVSPARDFAFVVAIRPQAEDVMEETPESSGGTTCAADRNRDGTVTLQDLFDYLNAFFNGCP